MYGGRLERYKNTQRVARIVKALNETEFKPSLEVYRKGPHRKRLEDELRLKTPIYRILSKFQPKSNHMVGSGKQAFFRDVRIRYNLL